MSPVASLSLVPFPLFSTMRLFVSMNFYNSLLFGLLL